MQNFSAIESLPKRFLWIGAFPWAIDTFADGRIKLERQTSTDSDSFERLPLGTKQILIGLQTGLDVEFYYDNLSAFQSAYAPEKLNRSTLRNVLSCVPLMRKQRRVGLTRDTIPMVDLEWYSGCLTRLFNLKDKSARAHLHTFLGFDYTVAECVPLCQMAYLSDLKTDPDYAPTWLGAMIGHKGVSEAYGKTEASVWLSRVLGARDAAAKDSPETAALLRLLAMHPNPERAWRIYYESILLSTISGQNSEAGTRHTFDQILSMCMAQLAYGNAMAQPIIWQGWVAAFPTILAYARDQIPNDQCVEDLEAIGWQVLDVAMGSSLAAGQAIGLDILEIFATLPPLGTDMDAALPELIMPPTLSMA